jgi:tetratricopeptide (TPR) repeat protein
MKIKLLIAGLLTVMCFPLTNVQGQNTLRGSGDRDPASTTGTGAGANFDQTFNAQQGSMRFWGKVVLEGSQLPWDPIPVVVNCDGKMRYNTFADAKGAFDIQATSRETEVVATKRDPKHVDPDQLVGCKVSAILEGFTSTTLTIANRSLMDDPDIGTITLRRDARATGSIVSDTTASAPAEALKEFDKARTDKVSGNQGSEQKHLQKAVNIDPQLAEAWYQLGKVEETDKPQDALNAYLKAAAIDPKFIPPYERIAALAAAQKKWQDVADAANHALQLNPAGTPQIWYFSALSNLNLGNKDTAETSALTSLGMDPGHVAAPKTEQLLAVIMASKGEYKEALEHLRKCLTYTPKGPEADLVKRQVTQLEKIVPQTTK